MKWISREHLADAQYVPKEPIAVVRYTLLLIYYVVTDVIVYIGGFMHWAGRESGLAGVLVAWFALSSGVVLVLQNFETFLLSTFPEGSVLGFVVAFPIFCSLARSHRTKLPFIYEIEPEEEEQQLREQQAGDAPQDGRGDRGDRADGDGAPGAAGDDGDDGEEPEGEGYDPEFVEEPPEIDFRDVAGNQELIEELHNKVIDPLNNPEKYEEYGLGVETGFLLYGPPGTGKTFTTKALAGTLGIRWMPVKGSDLTSRYVGAGTENIAKMFKEAIAYQPVLLFLDEIDALAPERGGANQHEDKTQQVNTMLEWISKIHDEDHDVVIIGATNRRDRIDDAMLRSGRLTTQIEVPYPDEQARVEIADSHLDAPRREIDWRQVADASVEMSAADMEAVADEAARLAMDRDEGVDTDDMLTAIESIRN